MKTSFKLDYLHHSNFTFLKKSIYNMPPEIIGFSINTVLHKSTGTHRANGHE
jgi:hypothetical protein